MDEENGFLNALKDNPNDLGLRLVYADWLEERDDLRGEFLRVQTRLFDLTPSDAEYSSLQAVEQGLLEECLAQWLAVPNAPVWSILGGERLASIPPWLVERNVGSWEYIVKSYRQFENLDGALLHPLLCLAQQVAASETAKLFRAGQSMWRLMISTAEQYGLAEGDPFVSVTSKRHGPTFELRYATGGKVLSLLNSDEEGILTILGQMLAQLWISTRGKQGSVSPEQVTEFPQ